MNMMEASWIGLVEFANELDPDPQFRDLSDEQVERQVRDGASRIAAMQCQWLLHLAEFVVRGTWAEGGARTPGQWLSWACGEAGSTAREHVRVGLALRHLPLIRERFAAGTLSYSKVRAITRVAVPEIEEDLVRLADSAPASVINTIVAKSRWAVEQRRRWQQEAPDEVLRERDLQRIPIDDHMVELRIRLPIDESAALEERIDWLVDVGDRADGGQRERPTRGARRALAVCDALATAVAAGGPDRSGVDDHLVVLHVDANELADAVHGEGAADGDAAEAPTGLVAVPDGGVGGDAAEAPGDREAPTWPGLRRTGPGSAGMRSHVTTGRGRGMMLPRSVLARLTCDADLRLAGITENGHPADIGRRSRKVPPDLRRALQLRDRRCRFPGCERTRGLHAHHVRHWAEGGPTDLSNLVLLCRHHHRFVHDRHWTLRPVDAVAGRWTFHAPGEDAPQPAVLALPGASAASLAEVASGPPPPPHALQPPWWEGARYDLSETVGMVADWIRDAAAA